MIGQLSPPALRDWLNDQSRPQPLLLDVREPWEYDLCRIIDSQLISLKDMPQRWNELPRGHDIIVICHHGVRSQQAARFLEDAGFQQLYNLSGGIAAWAEQIEPTMPRY